MNWRAILAIVRKDLKVVLQNKSVILPIVIIPLVLFVLLPWMAAFAPHLVNIAGVSFDQLNQLFARMPAGFQASLAGFNLDQKVIIFFLVYMLAPIFLILPLMVASVIAADSFAGERERKTLEALLYSPTTDRELFLAKLLSAWLPAIGVALIGFLLYAIMANAAGWSVMGQFFFPNLMWLALVFWVVPAAAGLGLGVMVMVSVRAQGFQDAYQLGSVVVVPVLLLVFGQVSGILYFSLPVVLLLGLGVWILNGILLWLGNRTFQRGRLISRV
jgi:ABC-2 type transport system permease protein